MNDLISRQAALEKIHWLGLDNDTAIKCDLAICALPSVNPQPKTGHCKDCKWWKDSDGVYRRGVRAESSCPFNTKEIYDGDAYCYRFEPQESEE